MQCLFYKTMLYPRENWFLSEALEVWHAFPSLCLLMTPQQWSPRQILCQHAESMAPVTPTASRDSPAGLGESTPTPTYAVWMLPVRDLGNVEHCLYKAHKENKHWRCFLRVDIDEAYIALHSAELTNSLPTPSMTWLAITTAGGCGPRQTSSLEHREQFWVKLDRLWDTMFVNLPVRYMPPVKQNMSWISKTQCTTVCSCYSASTAPLCLWWEVCRNTERKAEKCLREFSSTPMSKSCLCKRKNYIPLLPLIISVQLLFTRRGKAPNLSTSGQRSINSFPLL